MRPESYEEDWDESVNPRIEEDDDENSYPDILSPEEYGDEEDADGDA